MLSKDDIPETRIIGKVSDMNKQIKVMSTGRTLMVATALAALAGTLATPAAMATEPTARVIHEIVVTAQRPVQSIEEMVVTAPRMSRAQLADQFGIDDAIYQARLLAAGVDTQRAMPREIRLAAAETTVDRG